MVRSASEPLISKNKVTWDGALELFSEYFKNLEGSPKSTSRNVKMLLATRFMNHLYSSFLLVVSGSNLRHPPIEREINLKLFNYGFS
jgi:hypothetical protein